MTVRKLTIYTSALPQECYLDFNHPIMKSTYESIRLFFEAVYSNVLIMHIYCDAAKQPTLIDVKLLVRLYGYILTLSLHIILFLSQHISGLFLTKLKSEGIASYEISNLLVLTV